MAHKYLCLTATESTVLQLLVWIQTDLHSSGLPDVFLVCLWAKAPLSLGLFSVELGEPRTKLSAQ